MCVTELFGGTLGDVTLSCGRCESSTISLTTAKSYTVIASSSNSFAGSTHALPTADFEASDAGWFNGTLGQNGVYTCVTGLSLSLSLISTGAGRTC